MVLDFLTNETWLAWGVGLLIGFPLLTILFGEMLYRIERSDSNQDSGAYLGKLQYFVLPSLVIYLLMLKVLELDHLNLSVRVIATVFWISTLYLSLSIFNVFLFSGDISEDDWRSRVPSLVLNIARMFFVLLGIAIILSTVWEIDLGQMLAALGVGSIVLGLALRDTLGGLFAGITLISTRQFKIGDWLKAGDVIGKVITVNWYSSSLETLEGDLLVIPNSVLASDPFRNFSQPTSVHMERIVIQFWEEQAPNTVKKALLEAAGATTGVLKDPAPRIQLIEFGDDAGAYEAQIYFDDYGMIDSIRDAYLTHVWYTAKRYNIVFPYEDLQLFHFDGADLNLGSDDSIELGQLVDKLEQMNVFDITHNELELLTTDAVLLRFGVGEEIMRIGNKNNGLYVVLSGEAHETVPDQQGKQQNMGSVLPGDVFGLISVLHHCKVMINVYAKSDLQVVKLTINSIEKVLKSNPQFAQDLEQDIEKQMENIDTLHQRGVRDEQGNGMRTVEAADRVVNLRELIRRK